MFFPDDTDAIQKSLLSTTTHDLTDFADLIETLNKDTRTDDYRTIHHSIHLMHHMFLAHAKFAFLIHMQVVHDIDMRNADVHDPTMCNYCFFVNFEATHIPEQLTWEDGPRQMPQQIKTWLQKQKMPHTRVFIKTHEDTSAGDDKHDDHTIDGRSTHSHAHIDVLGVSSRVSRSPCKSASMSPRKSERRSPLQSSSPRRRVKFTLEPSRSKSPQQKSSSRKSQIHDEDSDDEDDAESRNSDEQDDD